MDLQTCYSFKCSGAELELTSWRGITLTDERTKISLEGVSPEMLQASILAYTSHQRWNNTDSLAHDEFLEALATKAAEVLQKRREERPARASD